MMDNNFNIYFYLDYLRFVEKLGLPKTSKILYPQNLRESHDKLEKKIQVIDSMEKQEQSSKFPQRLQKKKQSLPEKKQSQINLQEIS